MSTWTNEFDVFRDLDRLSGFKQSNTAYPALHAFGRGKLVVKEDRNGRKTTIAQFSPPPKIPVLQTSPEAGVASKMDNDTTWERDRDLYFQLRQVCGRGYSNELIEEEFRQSEWYGQERFGDPPVEGFLAEDSNKLVISDSEHTPLALNQPAPPQLESSSTELVISAAKDMQGRLFVHPPKLKPSRNALLNSLARRKILQLSDEPNMTAPPIAHHGRGTGCAAEDAITNEEVFPVAKFFGELSHCATEDRLTTSNVDLQKMEVEFMEICDQAQSFAETQKQCINWSDIRKFKTSCHSPGSVYSDGTPRSSPVHAVKSPTSQMSRKRSKVKSIPVTNTVDVPGLSTSSLSMGKESDTSEWKQGDEKKQAVSHQSPDVHFKSKTKRTKQYCSSLPSSPTNSITQEENRSWFSLRKRSSHPKHVMLSDYIDTSLELVPTHNFSENPCPLKEWRNYDELQINSVKDFPPLQ